MIDGKPYPLPETWTESSIGKVVVKAKQRDPRKKPNDVFQYVDVSSVSNESFKITGATPTLGSEAPSRARKAIETDDVLFATVRPTLKRIALVPSEFDGAIASTGYCVLRCDKAKAEPGFLYSFLITDHFNVRMAGLERGASYPAVRDSDVTASWLPLPPLSEQKKITHALSTVQQAIEVQERIIQTTTELKEALMHKLFTEGLRNEPQKQTEIGPVPESWEVVKLETIFECFDGLRKPVKKSDRVPGPYPYYGASGIVDYVDGYLFDGEYLLLAEDGENLDSRKLPIAFIVSGEFWVNNHAHILRTKRGNMWFYEQYIANMPIKDYLSGTTRPKLTKGHMMKMLLPFPPVDQQDEAAEALGNCDAKINSAEQKRRALQDLFRTLLHELMTAKIRVYDIDLGELEELETSQ